MPIIFEYNGAYAVTVVADGIDEHEEAARVVPSGVGYWIVTFDDLRSVNPFPGGIPEGIPEEKVLQAYKTATRELLSTKTKFTAANPNGNT